jgi:hypothetical protein
MKDYIEIPVPVPLTEHDIKVIEQMCNCKFVVTKTPEETKMAIDTINKEFGE